MKELLSKAASAFYLWSTSKVYEDGWNEGVAVGSAAARYLIEKELLELGSTGDYFEAKREDVLRIIRG